jgi:2-keto-4-pentenoate hydratase/2-oxohepta-3-ene-1,7-dioic acid hydratase in catechol pathway
MKGLIVRIANLAGRLVLVDGDRAIDVETASSGRFSADPQAIYDHWKDFSGWAETVELAAGSPFDVDDLQAPTPAPRQIFAIGLNYRDHAKESGQAIPDSPLVFTKFLSSLAGPTATITLPDGSVDWEVELVAVIGERAYQVSADDAWDHVAGLTVGQDISERQTQLRGPAPQFSLGKSFPNFSPVGPVVVTVDEFANRDSLRIQTELSGEGIDGVVSLQDGNTRDLIFSIPALIQSLSAVLPLLPGDIIFTGTPAGVGMGRAPRMFLKPGQVLTSTIEGIGQLRNVTA